MFSVERGCFWNQHTRLVGLGPLFQFVHVVVEFLLSAFAVLEALFLEFGVVFLARLRRY